MLIRKFLSKWLKSLANFLYNEQRAREKLLSKKERRFRKSLGNLKNKSLDISKINTMQIDEVFNVVYLSSEGPTFLNKYPSGPPLSMECNHYSEYFVTSLEGIRFYDQSPTKKYLKNTGMQEWEVDTYHFTHALNEGVRMPGEEKEDGTIVHGDLCPTQHMNIRFERSLYGITWFLFSSEVKHNPSCCIKRERLEKPL